MKKSLLYETIIKELIRINKFDSFFDRNDLRGLSDEHQKYMVFVYDYSNPKNAQRKILYFKRKAKVSPLQFKADAKIFNKYNNLYHIK